MERINEAGTGLIVTCEADGLRWQLIEDTHAAVRIVVLSGFIVRADDGNEFEIRRGRVEHGLPAGERKRIVGRWRTGALAGADTLCTVALSRLPDLRWQQL